MDSFRPASLSRGARWVALAGIALCSAIVLQFGVRSAVASWVLFTPDAPDPQLSSASEERLELALQLAPWDAGYHWSLAGKLHARFPGTWLRPDFRDLAERTLRHAEHARHAVPVNAYFRLRWAAVALDLARHPSTPEARSRALFPRAEAELAEAVALRPRSVSLLSSVARVGLLHWEGLGEPGREATLAAIGGVGTLGRLEFGPLLDALWDVLHLVSPPGPASVEIIDRTVPRQAGARMRLAFFWLRRAQDSRLTRRAGLDRDRYIQLARETANEALMLDEMGHWIARMWVRVERRSIRRPPEEIAADLARKAAAFPDVPDPWTVVGNLLEGPEAGRAYERAARLAVRRILRLAGRDVPEIHSLDEVEVAELRGAIDRLRRDVRTLSERDALNHELTILEEALQGMRQHLGDSPIVDRLLDAIPDDR